MDWVRELLEEYQDLGIAGLFGVWILNSYLRRYEEGERTEDLYESMATAE